MGIQTENPATGQPLKEYHTWSDETLDAELEQVNQRFSSWKNRTFDERAELMNSAAKRLRDRSEEIAELMGREMGKPHSQGVAEAEKCAWVCEYYAEHAEEFLADDLRSSDASKSYVSYQPIGPVLTIMPWNYPFWQVFRFAAPSLMAGNVGLLKHARNVTGCARAIESIFLDAGFPEHVFRTLPISVEQANDAIEDERVRAVTLTGSTRAGKAVASNAGSNVKKTVLELGGNDPYLILEDADLDRAVEQCVQSRMLNSGQSCIAAKRFIVHESHAEDFTDRVIQTMKELTMGPPEKDPDLGPQAREDLRDDLHDQVQRAEEDGATVALGGEIPDRDGYYYPPTVLTDVEPGMVAFEEELFGPVATVITASGEQEAVEMANQSPFGLGAAVFTEDEEKGEQIARDKLEAGCCFVNAFVKSDPRLPFGGVKESGYGRELSSEGIREFVNTKTVYIH